MIFNNIFEQIIDDYWFLKATFINCIFVMLVEKLFKGNTLVLLICPIVIFFLFRSTTVLSVMIYFALGYFISKRKKGIHIPKYIGWICMSIYVILIIMGMKGSLSAGFAGIFGVIGVVDLFVGFTKKHCKPIVSEVGKNTGAIYLISSPIFAVLSVCASFIGVTICPSFPVNIMYDILMLVPTAIIIFISIFIAKIIEKNSFLALIILGKQQKAKE